MKFVEFDRNFSETGIDDQYFIHSDFINDSKWIFFGSKNLTSSFQDCVTVLSFRFYFNSKCNESINTLSLFIVIS